MGCTDVNQDDFYWGDQQLAPAAVTALSLICLRFPADDSLFDLSCELPAAQRLSVQGPGLLVAKESGFQLMEQAPSDPQSTVVFQIKKHPRFFSVGQSCLNEEESKWSPSVWLMVRSLQDGYRLEEGDIIRMGELVVKVQDLQLEEEELRLQTKKHIYYDVDNKNTIREGEEPEICRICLDQGKVDNPLLRACHCKGSGRYIHYRCLQTWLNTKVHAAKCRSYAVRVAWQDIHCELCHTPYPYKVNLDGRVYNLVNLSRPPPPSLGLQVVEEHRTMYFLGFKTRQKVVLGRGNEADLTLTEDTSFSRTHCSIEFSEDGFVFKDLQSFYGSFVMVRKPLMVNYLKPRVSLMVRNYLVRVSPLTDPEAEFKRSPGEEQVYVPKQLRRAQTNSIIIR